MNNALLKLKNLAGAIMGSKKNAEFVTGYISEADEPAKNKISTMMDQKALVEHNGELYEQLLKEFPAKDQPKQYDEKELHKLSSFAIL